MIYDATFSNCPFFFRKLYYYLKQTNEFSKIIYFLITNDFPEDPCHWIEESTPPHPPSAIANLKEVFILWNKDHVGKTESTQQTSREWANRINYKFYLSTYLLTFFKEKKLGFK